ARPAELLAAAPPTAAPATTQASATPQAAAPLEAAPAAPTSDDDQLARLLAAKQRARKQRQ
ncbi:hypothetical protein SE17_37475, partial [Kouleothrix aurantiaca]